MDFTKGRKDLMKDHKDLTKVLVSLHSYLNVHEEGAVAVNVDHQRIRAGHLPKTSFKKLPSFWEHLALFQRTLEIIQGMFGTVQGAFLQGAFEINQGSFFGEHRISFGYCSGISLFHLCTDGRREAETHRAEPTWNSDSHRVCCQCMRVLINQCTRFLINRAWEFQAYLMGDNVVRGSLQR
jgi:hypothetical protein